MFTITLDRKTRKEMNTGTPRVGEWTYHHVLPVRYYFTLASLCTNLIAQGAPGTQLVTDASAILSAMPCNGANREFVRAFCVNKVGTATESDMIDAAKRCASPPWGGFGGMQPPQRCDDPGSLPEQRRPLSGSANWWAALQIVQTRLDALVPTLVNIGRDNDFTLKIDTTRAQAEIAALAAQVNLINRTDILPFEPSDWMHCPRGDKSVRRDWIFATRAAIPFAAVESFNKLNSIKNKPGFPAAWNDSRDAFGSFFALREVTDTPKGRPESYSKELHAEAMARKSVFRQINDLLVLYLPTKDFGDA